MEEVLNDYRKELRKRLLVGIIVRTIILILCVMAASFLLSSIVGWLQDWKVEGVLSQTILISLMIVIIAITIWIGYQILMTNKQYRTALLRMDILILKVKLNHGENLSKDWLERELQFLTRVLESYVAE